MLVSEADFRGAFGIVQPAELDDREQMAEHISL